MIGFAKGTHRWRNRVLQVGAFFLTMMTLSSAQAGVIYMAPGSSQVLQTQQDIDTVFISSPEVADYELIGSRSVILYAKSLGRSDFTLFDKEGTIISKSALVVDVALSDIQQQIAKMSPDSQVTIEKIGQSYLISGTVATEDDRDKVYQIVGEGIGAQKEITKKQMTSSGDTDSGDKENNWLAEVIYKGVINKLQIPMTNQVNVKLSVVEVTKSFTDNLGIDWSTAGATPGTFRFVKFNADTLTSLVHAISNDSIASVLAEPNLSVLSGETAEFLVGGEVPIVTSSATNGTSVQYKEFGIKLNVGAKVSSNKRIRLTLSEEVSNIDGSFNSKAGDSFPALQTRRARTTVELANGESFLLGGLISNNESEALSRVPFIGDVPILGALFRNASSSRSHRELMVLATVNLVKPVSQSSVIFPGFQRTPTWARFLNLDGILNSGDRKKAQEFIEQGGFIK